MHISADTLVEALRTRGLRITAPRRAVCEVIASGHDDHLDAAAIAETATTPSGPIDTATVYRTLETLTEAGIITHTHLPHGAAVYHLADSAPHAHLVCDTCGSVTSLDTAATRPIESRIEKTTGFAPDLAHFAISGRCKTCHEAATTP